MKILIADDEMISRKMLQKTLERAAYEVTAVENGRLAAEQLCPPDWNRGVIMDLLGRELARSRREQVCTAILMCDLDHFKSINDTYGHPAGDDALRETAKRLLASVRSYDFVGRYGGEEFLVVLNNCNPAFAFARAEDIRKTIAQTPVPSASGPIPVTMSVGLLLSQDWGHLPAEELLPEADAALPESLLLIRTRKIESLSAYPADPQSISKHSHGARFLRALRP